MKCAVCAFCAPNNDQYGRCIQPRSPLVRRFGKNAVVHIASGKCRYGESRSLHAAASDLLKAAKAVIERIDGASNYYTELEALRAAVKKAEGELPPPA